MTTIRETLEAMIPAILEIEGGYHENACEFISDANQGLAEIGSSYCFEATSKMVGTEGEWAGLVEDVDYNCC